MTLTGFFLRRLTLKGPRVPDAKVRFDKGLNVISGPSDTGKTFIAQCIDYMLGANNPPKEIPEALPYESILLRLGAQDEGKEFILERSLRGGNIRLRVDGQPDRILGSKHQADKEDTLSHYLLELSGFVGKKVRTNQRGNTRTLSFRDLSRLVLVDEETVISDRSPIFSGQNMARTAEVSVFRLFLTGVDDSSVIAKDDPKIAKGRQEGKSEMVQVMLERTRQQIAEMNLNSDAVAIRKHLKSIETLYEKACSELADERKLVAIQEERRRTLWTRLRQIESQINVLSGLQGRFELLQKQYYSDLSRLESIAEAGIRLGQMKEERCPVCGALAEHHVFQHQQPKAALEEVASACRAEAQKIHALLSDLKDTMEDNAAEISRLSKEKSEKRAELDAVESELRDHVKPRVQAALQKFQDSQAQRDRYRRAVELYDRIEELEGLLSEVGHAKRTQLSDGVSTAVGANEVEQFSIKVETLLRAWHFPNLDRVTFSEDKQDLVISGRHRASHGKGVRAITHAAFKLALLRYCRDLSRPHPGFVLIDSPLVVYREPDMDEGGFTRDVKDAFYRTLAKDFMDAQVIILENEDPPSDIDSLANVIRFTGTSHGRKGFIPA